MELSESVIYRRLDSKIQIAGMGICSLLAVLLFASVMSLLFSNSYVVFIPSLALWAILYFGERDKPEGYLLHLARFYLSPKSYSAGERGILEDERNKKIIK